LSEFVNIGEDAEGTVLNSPIVKSDEQRIMQVLLGLQSNALKFTLKGRVVNRVEILEQDSKRYIQISVIDTGIGIAIEDQ
jgi:signal transduction histidine kinase